MAVHETYHFRAIAQTRLGPGDERDPFRFYSDRLFQPSSVDAAFSMEVQDVDHNRKLDEQDVFISIDAQGQKRRMLSGDGLKLLNYYLDPEVLKSKALGVVLNKELREGERGMAFPMESFGLNQDEIEQVRKSHFPYWEIDGHIDLDILQGFRTFTKMENERWTSLSGSFTYWDWHYFTHEVLTKKGAIALSFVSVENATTPHFVWQTYTTNFFSLLAGSFYRNNRAEGILEAGYLHADGDSTSVETRRMVNMESAKARSKISKDHLFWLVTWPIVLGACFADSHFRKFWSAPWRVPKFGLLYDYYAGQFNRALPFMGRSPLAWGVTVLSAYQVYDLSSHWFEAYAGLPRESMENKIMSTGSTLFAEVALQSRASREMEAVLGSARLNFRNLSALQRSSLALRLRFYPTRMNFFGLKPVLPKAALELSWKENATSVLARKNMVAPLAGGEILLAERAGLQVTSRLIASATEVEVLGAENVVIRSSFRSVGLPLLAMSALIGAGIGVYHLFSSDE